jgi:hypothetical protein
VLGSRLYGNGTSHARIEPFNIMGRKGRERQVEEVQHVRYYQWEFLRRNPDYQRGYEKLLATFSKWFSTRGFWYEREKNYSDRDYIFYYNSICPVLMEICANWNICQPLPPDWGFDIKTGRHEYAPNKFAYLPTGWNSEDAGALWHGGDMEITGLTNDRSEAFSRPFTTQPKKQGSPKKEASPVQQSVSDERHLTLRLDASRPTEELLGEVVNAVQLHRDRHRKFFATLEKQKSRRRLDQYDVDLKVWDLRKRGVSFPEIAKQVYPTEYRSHPPRTNPIVQRVTDHYRRAEKLILGGYKDLR